MRSCTAIYIEHRSQTVFPLLRRDSSVRCCVRDGENHVSSSFSLYDLKMLLFCCLFQPPNLKRISVFRYSWASDERRGEAPPLPQVAQMFVGTKIFVLSDVGSQGVLYSDIRIKPSAEATSSPSDRCAETAHTDDVTYSEVLVLYQKSKS